MKHEERAHSKLGASGAHRWMACPGSIRLSANLEDVSSVYAAEGTAAHELAERCLRSGAPAADHIGDEIPVGNHVFTVDEEMAVAVQVYLDAVRGDYDDGDLLFIEARFSLAHLHPGMFGTNDAALYKVKTGKLIVYDYKHGAGYIVDVVRNPQLIYYGIGNLSTPDMATRPLSEVELVIVQPRAAGEPVRRWSTDVLELFSFAGDLIDAAKATADPNAPLSAGAWCKFCPAAGFCPALREQSIADAQSEFTDAPEDLSADALATILGKAELIGVWIKAVRAEVFRRARDGEIIPGFKFVQKRGRRVWSDAADARAYLLDAQGLTTDDVDVPSVLKSPAQIEKLLPKADRQSIARFITAASSGVTLVPETDKRPAVPADLAAEDDFND